MQPLPRPCREVRTACAPRSADSVLSSFRGISSHISGDGCRFPALIGREELTSSCPQLSAVKSSLFQCAAGDDTECSSWAAHAPGFDFLSEQIGATAGLELRIYVENIVVVGDWREDDWRTSIYGLVTSCVYVHAALSSSFCPWVWLWIKVVSGAVRDSRSQPDLPDFSLSHIFFSLLFIPSFYLFVAGAQGHIFPSLKFGLFLSLPLTLWVTAIGKRSRIRSCFHLQVEMNGGLSAAHMWLFPRKKKLLWLLPGRRTNGKFYSHLPAKDVDPRPWFWANNLSSFVSKTVKSIFSAAVIWGFAACLPWQRQPCFLFGATADSNADPHQVKPHQAHKYWPLQTHTHGH